MVHQPLTLCEMGGQTAAMADLYDLSDLEMLARDCLARAGLPTADARLIARDVALSQSAGHDDCGFEALLRDIRLLRYDRIKLGAVPVITSPAGAVLHVDAAHGFAAPAVARALPRLIEMAMKEGVALLHLMRASDPGTMAGAMADLSTSGLAGLSLGPQGTTFAVRPRAQRITPLEERVDTSLSALLSLAPPEADSPLDGPVAHKGWIAALNPALTSAEALLDSLPMQSTAAATGGVRIAPDLLAQIVNA